MLHIIHCARHQASGRKKRKSHRDRRPDGRVVLVVHEPRILACISIFLVKCPSINARAVGTPGGREDARHALRNGSRQPGMPKYAAPGAAEISSHGDSERIPVLRPGPESDGNARLDRYNSRYRRFNGDLTASRIRRHCPSARLEYSPLSLVELEWDGRVAHDGSRLGGRTLKRGLPAGNRVVS